MGERLSMIVEKPIDIPLAGPAALEDIQTRKRAEALKQRDGEGKKDDSQGTHDTGYPAQ